MKETLSISRINNVEMEREMFFELCHHKWNLGFCWDQGKWIALSNKKLKLED